MRGPAWPLPEEEAWDCAPQHRGKRGHVGLRPTALREEGPCRATPQHRDAPELAFTYALSGAGALELLGLWGVLGHIRVLGLGLCCFLWALGVMLLPRR